MDSSSSSSTSTSSSKRLVSSALIMMASFSLSGWAQERLVHVMHWENPSVLGLLVPLSSAIPAILGAGFCRRRRYSPGSDPLTSSSSSFPPPHPLHFWSVHFPIGLFLFLSFHLTSLAPLYMSYPTFLAARAAKLLPTMAVGTLWLRKRYSSADWNAAILCAIGLALTVLGETTSQGGVGGGSGSRSSSNTGSYSETQDIIRNTENPENLATSSSSSSLMTKSYSTGLFILFGSLFFDGIASNAQQALFEQHHVNAREIATFTMGTASFLSFLHGIISGGLQDGITSLLFYNSYNNNNTSHSPTTNTMTKSNNFLFENDLHENQQLQQHSHLFADSSLDSMITMNSSSNNTLTASSCTSPLSSFAVDESIFSAHQQLVLLVTLYGIASYFSNVAVLTLLRDAGAASASFVSAVCKAAVIAFSFLIFPKPISVFQITGMALIVGAVALVSYAKRVATTTTTTITASSTTTEESVIEGDIVDTTEAKDKHEDEKTHEIKKEREDDMIDEIAPSPFSSPVQDTENEEVRNNGLRKRKGGANDVQIGDFLHTATALLLSPTSRTTSLSSTSSSISSMLPSPIAASESLSSSLGDTTANISSASSSSSSSSSSTLQLVRSHSSRALSAVSGLGLFSTLVSVIERPDTEVDDTLHPFQAESVRTKARRRNDGLYGGNSAFGRSISGSGSTTVGGHFTRHSLPGTRRTQSGGIQNAHHTTTNMRFCNEGASNNSNNHHNHKNSLETNTSAVEQVDTVFEPVSLRRTWSAGDADDMDAHLLDK